MRKKILFRRQPRDGKNQEQEVDDKKAPVGEIMMIPGGQVAGGSLKSLKKEYVREVNNVQSRYLS